MSPSAVTDRKQSVHVCLQTKCRRHISNPDRPNVRSRNVEPGSGTFPAYDGQNGVRREIADVPMLGLVIDVAVKNKQCSVHNSGRQKRKSLTSD